MIDGSAQRQLQVAVLGAGGTIAPAIVRDLSESREVASMTLLDLDGERAAAVAEQAGGGKAVALELDAREPELLADALSDSDVLVNSASYRINLDAMRACLTAGCHYLDLGGLYWMTKRQLECSAEFERAGLLAILGIGSSPGKTNLMALRAIRELGGPGTPIETIEVCAAGRDTHPAEDGRLRIPYALATLLDELTMEPVVIEGGLPVALAPLSDGGPVDFGDPIGVAPTIYTLHSELASFPDSFGTARASFRLSLPPALLDELTRLAGAGEDEVAAAARRCAPQSTGTVSVHLVRVSAADGRVVSVRAVSEPHFGLGGSVVSTAAPAAAAVRLLAGGAIGARGAHPPERCIDPEEMFAQLRERGCSFSVTG